MKRPPLLTEAELSKLPDPAEPETGNSPPFEGGEAREASRGGPQGREATANAREALLNRRAARFL